MCSRIKCAECNKPSYAGCGAHVEQVLGDVPREQRCKCREEKREAKKQGGEKSTSLFDKLFGR